MDKKGRIVIQKLHWKDMLKSWKLVNYAVSVRSFWVYVAVSLLWSPAIILALAVLGRKIYILKKDGKIHGGMMIQGKWVRSLWAWPRHAGYGKILFKAAVKKIGRFPRYHAAQGSEGFYERMRKRHAQPR